MKFEFDIPEDSHGLCRECFEQAYNLPSPKFLFINNNLTSITESKKYPRLADWKVHSSYLVRFYGLAETNACIEQERLLCTELRLLSNGKAGRVLLRFRFNILRENLKQQGIATQLLSSEEELIAKEWRAEEIQTIVTGQGFLAWTRPRFEYSIAHSDLLRLRADCARRQLVDEKVAREMNKIEDFPRKFWELLSTSKSGISATFFKPVNCEQE